MGNRKRKLNKIKKLGKKKDCQFRLRPRGMRPPLDVELQENELQSATPKEDVLPTKAEIKKYREEAKKIFDLESSHQDRNDLSLLNKSAYLYRKLEDSKNTHTQFLNCAQLTYILADWHTLFCDGRQMYQHDREYFLQLQREMGQSREQQIEYAISMALVEDAQLMVLRHGKDDPQNNIQREKIRVYLKQIQEWADNVNKNADRALSAIKRKYNDHELDAPHPSQVLPWIRRDQGDMEESVEDEKFNAMFWRIFFTYCSRLHECKTVNKMLRDYKPEYSHEDLVHAKEDMDRVKQLKVQFEKVKSWFPKKLTFQQIFGCMDFSSSSTDTSKEQEETFLRNEGKIQKVIEVTRHYYDELTKGGSNKIKDCLVRAVIINVAKFCELNVIGDHNNEPYIIFPFVYLTFCIFCKETFSRRTTVDYDLLNDKFNKSDSLYNQRPSRARQRLARIRLLNQLNQICSLSSKSSEMNWELFLNLHGSEILSDEEGMLWDEIIERLPNSTPLQLMKLRRTISSCLENCLPLYPEDLFCYRCFSQTSLGGGFFSYIEQYPETVQKLQAAISQSEYWEKKEEEYFKRFFQYDYDIDEIYTWFSEKIGRAVFDWNSIPHASDMELQQFFENIRYRPRYNGNTNDDITEMRSLLVEYTLRKNAAERIKFELKEIAEAEIQSICNFSRDKSAQPVDLSREGGDT